jgi:NAD(P)-dependent dehydrogenase (short-subunit alcohol dehydrogenase family)
MARAWSEADIQDLNGATAVVTGASSGIGLEVARGLASKNAHVVLAVRSLERGQVAAAAIRATSPRAWLEVTALDLADLASVHRFAEGLGLKLRALDLLINNAGVASPLLEHTADGFELDFGTNHLGHFVLTGLLLADLMASPKARVVTVTSMAHAKGQIDFDNLDGSQGYDAARAYAQSKLANVLFAYELQRRLSIAGADQVSLACHPGWAATNLTLGSGMNQPRLKDRLLHLLAKRFAPSPAEGARPILYAATSAEVRGGEFIGPSGRFGVGGNPTHLRSSEQSYNEDLARRLWEVSERLTSTTYSFVRPVPAPAVAMHVAGSKE